MTTTIGVAIAVPEPWGEQLQSYREGLGDATASRHPHPHHADAAGRRSTRTRCRSSRSTSPRRAATNAAFRIHLRGTGTFRPVSPVVFVMVAEGISGCEQLAASVRRGPLDADLQFPYHPHVTVAHHLADETLDRAFDDLAGFECDFTVDRFSLYVHDRGLRLGADARLRAGGTARCVGPRHGFPEGPRHLRRRPAAREATEWLDHVVRMVQHYGAVNGNAQAGAVTFFGFLSFFPILALGFFVIGLLAQFYPDLKDQMVVEINELVPGVIGSEPGQIQLSTIESYSATIGIVGLVVVVYAGLGWLSGMRQALEVMFVVPRREQPSFVVGKLRDLGTLAVIGLTLTVSVALSGCGDRLLRGDPGLGRHRPDLAACRPCWSTSSGTRWPSRRPRCCC